MKITRQEEFETAHVLPFYTGGCGKIHGHYYKIEVTVEGPQKSNFDMVMDFKDLKKAIKEIVPDHEFVMYKDDPISNDIKVVLDKYGMKYEIYPFYTTAENMVGYFAERIEEYIKNELGYNDVKVVKVKLWETTNSFATWEAKC